MNFYAISAVCDCGQIMGRTSASKDSSSSQMGVCVANDVMMASNLATLQKESGK